jgi:hypothetical protein
MALPSPLGLPTPPRHRSVGSYRLAIEIAPIDLRAYLAHSTYWHPLSCSPHHGNGRNGRNGTSLPVNLSCVCAYGVK